MGRPSSIDRLPPDILEQLQALLRDPRVTQLEATARINEILDDEGRPERVSKSAVNRYAVSMARVGERLQQSRAVAEMWIAKLGAQPQGQVGHLVNEILRTLAFDVAIAAQDGGVDADNAPAVASMLKDLAISAEKLEKAASENVKREAEISQRLAAEAADRAEAAAKRKGISQDGIAALRAAIMEGL